MPTPYVCFNKFSKKISWRLQEDLLQCRNLIYIANSQLTKTAKYIIQIHRSCIWSSFHSSHEKTDYMWQSFSFNWKYFLKFHLQSSLICQISLLQCAICSLIPAPWENPCYSAILPIAGTQIEPQKETTIFLFQSPRDCSKGQKNRKKVGVCGFCA